MEPVSSFLIICVALWLPEKILRMHAWSKYQEALREYYTRRAFTQLEEQKSRMEYSRALQEKRFLNLTREERARAAAELVEEKTALEKVRKEKQRLLEKHVSLPPEYLAFVEEAKRNPHPHETMNRLFYSSIQQNPSPVRPPLFDENFAISQLLGTIGLLLFVGYVRGKFGGDDDGSESSD